MDIGLAAWITVGLALSAAVLAWRRVRGRSAGGGGPGDTELEHALKRLHEMERRDRTATAEALGSALGIAPVRARELASALRERDLLQESHEGDGPLLLTPAGRRAAAQIVRGHRLWERYLADRTGTAPPDWHREADRMEHLLTPEEANALASRLGRPRFDPHGDPIPTREGELPDPVNRSLTELEVGEECEVLHVEDEPPEVFAGLIEAGIAPGRRVRVLGADDRRLQLRVDGVDCSVGRDAAAGVRVGPLPEGATVQHIRRTLAEVPVGEAARVLRIAPDVQGPRRRRLLDLGVIPDTRITPELVAAGGDPVAYRIRGALVALRQEQASWIEVDPEPEEASPECSGDEDVG